MSPHPSSSLTSRPSILKKSTGLMLSLIFMGMVSLSGCSSSENSSGPGNSQEPSGDSSGIQNIFDKTSVQEANELYEEAWRTVYQDFYDPSFNGQDWLRWQNHYKGILMDKDDA
ncbi:MAG: hypothetical protein K2X66_10150, partial [Cyanobacteria bacterium]|nr:hypothetical protein [Cyanobacteriota bacterium]